MFTSLTERRLANKGFWLGDGIDLAKIHSSQAEPKHIIHPNDMRNAHAFTFGGSRSGKSRGLLGYLRYGIASGRDVICFDPKFEKEIFPTMVEAARWAGREKDIIYINAVQPEISAKINPFAEWKVPEEVVEHIVAGIPPSPVPFFSEQATKVGLIGIKMDLYFQKQLGIEHPNFPISHLQEIFSQSWIREQYNYIKEQARVSNDPELKTIVNLASSLTELSEQKFEEVCSSLTNVLVRLGTGIVRQVIDTNAPNVLLDRLWNGKGVICYIYTGSMIARESAYMVARVILSMLQSFIGKVYASHPKGMLPRTLEVHIDEASNVFYPGISDLFNKAGGANVWLHCLTQSVADVDDKIGENKRQVILDSCASKTFLVCGDPDKTGRYVATQAGRVDGVEVMLRAGTGLGDSSMIKDKEKVLLDPSAVTKLKARQFFSFIRDHGNYVGKFRPIPGPSLQIAGLRGE